jgi:hypothetical protein
MAGNTIPQPNSDPSDQDVLADPMAPRIPLNIRTKLANLVAPACAEIIQAAKDKDVDLKSTIYTHPSGLLGTDDDRGLYRHGRSIHL